MEDKKHLKNTIAFHTHICVILNFHNRNSNANPFFCCCSLKHCFLLLDKPKTCYSICKFISFCSCFISGEVVSSVDQVVTIVLTIAVTTLLADVTCGAPTADVNVWAYFRNGENNASKYWQNLLFLWRMSLFRQKLTV